MAELTKLRDAFLEVARTNPKFQSEEFGPMYFGFFLLGAQEAVKIVHAAAGGQANLRAILGGLHDVGEEVNQRLQATGKGLNLENG